MKKITKKLFVFIAALAAFILPISAFAGSFTWSGGTYRNLADDTDLPFSITPFTYADGSYLVPVFEGRGDTGVYKFLDLNAGGITVASGNVLVNIDSIEGLRSTLDSKVSTTSLAAQLSGINVTPFNLTDFMLNHQASTTALVATSTFPGFMSASDKVKLDSITAPVARTFSTTTRSITSSTGASGFQVSSTRDALVSYSVKVSTTATIGTPSEGYVVLEISPTNSSSPSSWYPVGLTCGNGQNITLAALLSSVQTTYCSLSTVVPAGYYVKLRSVTVTDSPSFTYLSGSEILE